jgi:ribonuclease VapC
VGRVLMFIDASVIVAILGREPGHEELEKRLVTAEGPYFVSPLVMFEASVGLARQKSAGKPTQELMRRTRHAVQAFIEDLGAVEIDISPEIGKQAFETSAVYGKAVGHAADLNFGDCFAHACAKTLGVTLLYKGDDFAQTDLA